MSSVTNVSGVGRVVLPAMPSRTADSATNGQQATENRSGQSEQHDPSKAEVDKVTGQPVPPRFPWLSRLSRELESASKQASPYGTIPLLGEKLDQQA